jgi:hypothetical protein
MTVLLESGSIVSHSIFTVDITLHDRAVMEQDQDIQDKKLHQPRAYNIHILVL